MLYPLLWMLASSFKPENVIFSIRSLWPQRFSLENYAPAGPACRHFAAFFLNSLHRLGPRRDRQRARLLAGRLRLRAAEFRFKHFWFAVMLGTIMLPYHATLIPQYVLFLDLGWVNTFLPLIVPKFLAVDAFFIFLMMQFIRGIPRELDEAATIDGCGPFRIYW